MATRAGTTYGLIAEFDDPTSLVAAAANARDAGYRCMDAYSPFPIEELHHALGSHQTKLPLIVLIGGLVGCLGGYALQYWASAITYPLNVGGKPLHSWPAFIPVTFECTILVAALSAVLGMLALNGLPQPYHPVFNVSRFALEPTRRFLETLSPREVTTVAD